MAHLERFVCWLQEHVGVCDIWIDGSFISEKVDPEDIDLTFVIDGEVYDRLPPHLQTDIESFEDGSRLLPELHVFPLITRPRHDGNFEMLERFGQGMAQWWAVARGGWLKGLPVIRLGETDVGLRILP